MTVENQPPASNSGFADSEGSKDQQVRNPKQFSTEQSSNPLQLGVQESGAFNNTEQAEELNNLDAILAKWRWLVPADVDVRIKWDSEIDSDGYRALCSPDARNNRLFIKVNPVEDDGCYTSFGFDVARDVELDVVHELLHWRFNLFEPESNTPAYELWEAAVERTAQDLLKLHRGKG